jgi:uncharacterized protein YbjT (DUF2867 family)
VLARAGTLAGGLLLALSSIAPATAAASDLVVVAGATGRSGKLVVEQLVAAHWKVRALVRDAGKAGDMASAPGVELRVADVRDPASLAAALKGATYVISAIGASGGFKSAPGDGPKEVDFQGVRNLAVAAKAANVKQFVLISSAGTGHADSYPSAFMRPFLQAKAAGEEALRASGVPYTIVRPGGLTDDPAGAQLALSHEDTASGRIARADVALVCIAALGQKSALGKTFDVVNGDPGPASDWKLRFAALQADPPAATSP